MGRTANRAFDILELIGDSATSMRHGEIAKKLDIPKGSLSKLIRVLIDRGYLVLDPTNQTYSVGPHVLALSRAFLKKLNIVEVAKPIIRETMTIVGESASLQIRRENQVLIVYKENSPRVVTALVHVGDQMPLYSSAGGKAILAHFSAFELDHYLSNVELKPITKKTIQDKQILIDQLEEIRQTGIATCDAEQVEEVIAFAAPIFNPNHQVTAAIDIAIPNSRLTSDIESTMKNTLMTSAKKISLQLGVDIHFLETQFKSIH